MTRKILLLLTASLLLQVTALLAADGPSKDVPELQALANYIGKWDVVFKSKELPFTKGESTAKWILGGRFLEQTGSITLSDGTNDLKLTTLMTYDQNENAYRMWSFVSNGSTSEGLGKWDAKKRIMTSVRKADGMTTTTTADFSKDGTEEWSIVTKNQSNEVVSEIAGTNTRTKD